MTRRVLPCLRRQFRLLFYILFVLYSFPPFPARSSIILLLYLHRLPSPCDEWFNDMRHEYDKEIVCIMGVNCDKFVWTWQNFLISHSPPSTV